MSFVELNRYFVPIEKDQEADLEIGRLWGRKIGGWMEWGALRQYRRVVLLAEAWSGKSSEFRNQADRLVAEGYPAFFIRIEELADQGFETALDPGSVERFEQWRDGVGEGWFFLDSVDEARLNHKSFDSALKRFARELGRSVERARVFISCRVSDWKGRDDRALIERHLPAWERPKAPGKGERASPLLDPIFKAKGKTKTLPMEQPDRKPNELLVVQLAPLSRDQYRGLATALGVNNVNPFVAGISQNGLDAFTERPGDLIDLVDYWKTYGRFAPFAEMVEHSINNKLREADAYRPDNEVLSFQKAREGAERLAAALTLGKSFTLRAPGYDPDPSLASGAIDPALILEDWTDAARNALLRRGVFAPSTYGRIRFHSRSTQEYLTASWFDRIVRSGCPHTEVWDLIFASRYGVETVVPSLRPAASWLALRQPDFLEEIIRREPLILLQNGDPGSLALEARKRLLVSYATKHAASEISDDSVDHRALWMFADPGLAEAIREAWHANPQWYFRMDLLRLIREGAISACADLARSIALDETAEDYARILALQSLDACNDSAALASLAQRLAAAPAKPSARLAASFARILYPRYLTTEEILALIEKSQPPHENAVEGFPQSLMELYDACPDDQARSRFVGRLADLCLSRPFVQEYQRISGRYFDLAENLLQIAKRELLMLRNVEPPVHLVQLLMVVERAERNHISDDEGPPLHQLVQSHTTLPRTLFWFDVEEQRAHSADGNRLIRYWQIYLYGDSLWKLGTADLPWLYEDLSQRTAEEDQRIALSAIVSILRQAGTLETEAAHLRDLVQTRAALKEDLDGYLTPPRESEEMQKHRLLMEEHQRQITEKEEKGKASWLKFSQDLRENPDQLWDPKCLQSWKAGAFRLWHLTEWLMHRTDAREMAAPCQWRLLEEGFGGQVAEAYRDGMKALWRLTKPEAPKRNDGGAITFKRTNILAFGAIGLEAAEDWDWTAKLSSEEAKRAALHGCLTEKGYPEWVESLLISHPQAVLPVLKRRVRDEWLSRLSSKSDFLHHFASPAASIHPGVQEIIFQTLAGAEPDDLGKLDSGVRIIKNLDLDQGQILKLARVVRRRLSNHAAAGRVDIALRYLATLLLLDSDHAGVVLEDWLDSGNAAEGQIHGERTFEFLFDPHDPILSGALTRTSVLTLEKLLRLAYSYIRPEHDITHVGGYSPGRRDNAERARNVILSALIERTGADSFRALRRVADDPEYALRAGRFRELARGKAERDTEPAAWSAKEVVAFERRHTAPVKTGVDLLRVVMAVLSNVQFQLEHGDVSSRPLLQRAKDEDEIQNWIVEQINYRSSGRFNAYREAQVAGGDRPDVIVSSTAAQCEVAIEVKHGGKPWTPRQLERALRNQLARNYLKPPTRRHGVFVITHHGMRHWRDPETNRPVTFDALINWLDKIASILIENDNGPIEVKCFGIDASTLKKDDRRSVE